MFDEAVKNCEKHGDITENSDDYETPVGNLKAWVRTEIAVVRGISKLARTPEQLELLAKMGITSEIF